MKFDYLGTVEHPVGRGTVGDMVDFGAVG